MHIYAVKLPFSFGLKRIRNGEYEDILSFSTKTNPGSLTFERLLLEKTHLSSGSESKPQQYLLLWRLQ